MKAPVLVVSFIALGLIAFEKQPELFGSKPEAQSVFPAKFAIQAEILKHSQFASTAKVGATERHIDVQLTTDSLFLAKNSTSFKPDAEKQLTELVSHINSFDKASRVEVSLLGYNEPGFNPKFRNSRLRKVADKLKTVGIEENRIQKVWQVLLDDSTSRDLASEARLSASPTQFISIRFFSGN